MISTNVRTSWHRRWRPRTGMLGAVVFPCLLAFSGCSRGPAMSEVRGKVFYNDGSVPQGGVCVVRFQPTENSTAEVRNGATGAIAPDGSFEMYTRTVGDGVYHGEYVVTFAVLKAVMDPKPLIVDKYMRPQTSPFTVTVDGDIEDLKFEIEPLPGAPRAAAPSGAG